MMSGQQMTNPELNSVHSVKVLLCYILDKLNRSVSEEQLRIISEDSGIINYFYFADALDELIRNNSIVEEATDGTRMLSITEKGRLGSEYFNRYIPLVFRKKLLHAAYSFFINEQNENICSCSISDIQDGCKVDFKLHDKKFDLIDMSFYAPDRDQAEMIMEKIKSNPAGAYKKILGFLLNNEKEEIDIEKHI